MTDHLPSAGAPWRVQRSKAFMWADQFEIAKAPDHVFKAGDEIMQREEAESMRGVITHVEDLGDRWRVHCKPTGPAA